MWQGNVTYPNSLLFPYLNFTLILLKSISSSHHFIEQRDQSNSDITTLVKTICLFLFRGNVSILLFSLYSDVITKPFSCDLPCCINSFWTLYFSDFTPPCFINSFIKTFSSAALISTLYTSFVLHTPWKQQYLLYDVSYLFCPSVACLCATKTNNFNSCQIPSISVSPVLLPQETLPIAFPGSLPSFYFSLLSLLWKVSWGFTTIFLQITSPF